MSLTPLSAPGLQPSLHSEVRAGASPQGSYTSLCQLLDVPQRPPQAQSPGLDACLRGTDLSSSQAPSACDLGGLGDLGSAAAGWGGLLGAGGPPTSAAAAAADALAALAAQQQQQQQAALAAELAAADPLQLLSLGNLLSAQQGLSARVQELLLLKQQLQAVVPQRPGGGIRGTGPIANPLYKVSKQFEGGGQGALHLGVRLPAAGTGTTAALAVAGSCPRRSAPALCPTLECKPPVPPTLPAD